MSERPKWIPIESNPEVMNKFLSNVGVPDEWQIVDVIGLDEELLPFIAGPVLSLILLFPSEVANDSTDDVKYIDEEDLKKIYVMRQTIGSACGTIAMIHSVANNCDKIEFKANSSLKKFLDSSQELSPEERGKLLESNEAICRAHYNSAKEGQTVAPLPGAPVNRAFVALIHKNGVLYEMNGRNPLIRGNTSEESFVSDAAAVCRQYMSKDPKNLSFSVLAFCYQN